MSIRSVMAWLFPLLFAAFPFASVLAESGTEAQPSAHAGFYLRHFGGRVDPQTIAHAVRVFERVRAVADKNAKRWPQLVVIRDLPAQRILALPDGHVVLPAKALELMYRGVDPELGDARLAFVLGHELAHMAEDDFWDQEIARTLSGGAGGVELPDLAARHHAVAKETKADDDGFLYALLAGYPVHRLLDGEGGEDFLSSWVRQTGGYADAAHASPAARANLLRLRLKERLDEVEMFHFAVRLAHFGRCADALQFLFAFQKRFPSREVFNNIGYCRLQQALDSMTPERAGLYWLPGVLDGESRLARVPPEAGGRLTLRGGALNSLTQDLLRRAERAIDQAVEKDGFYVPGLVNLATVHFLQGEVYKARAVVEQARKRAPEDPAVLTLRALILHEEGLEMDLGPDVIGLLERIVDEHDGWPMARFNLARLLEQRGHRGRAQRQWAALAERADELPGRIRAGVCARVSGVCPTNDADGVDAAPWRPPLAIGTDLFDDREAAALAGSWRSIPFDWPGDPALSGEIRVGPRAAVLVIDGIVEMAALRPRDGPQRGELERRFGRPASRRCVGGDVVWSYGGWAVRLAGERVREVWIVGEP